MPAGAVRASDAELAAAQASTMACQRRITAILVPRSTADVVAILRIATETRHAVYAYSRGRNWGLGSKLPTQDDCALIDLSAMDRILDYDPALGAITVEPGVHFAQVAAFLREKDSPFYASVIGGSPYASLIGNALERGGGDGPLSNRAEHMTALEVVLGSGEIVRSGFARCDRASTAKLVRYGVGPGFESLFVQSNFGVVTQATFWLQRKPVERAHLSWRVQKLSELMPLLDALRALLQEGVIPSTQATLWNGTKILARSGPRAATSRGLHNESVTGIARSDWLLVLQVHAASQALLDATLAHVRERLQHPSRQAAELTRANAPAALWQQLEPGTPSGANVLSAYWRKPDAPEAIADLDPDRDRCGVLWICPSLPLDGSELARVLAQLEALVAQHGFEANIGLNPVSPRAVEAYLAIMFDRDVPGEDTKALRCHDAVLAWLTAQGHLPYRLGVQSMAHMPQARDDTDAWLGRVKKASDPAGIISPARYEARGRGSKAG